MKRKELEAALKLIGEEQADRLKALTSAFSGIDFKSLECAPLVGDISAALRDVIPVPYSETDLQSVQGVSLTIANAARGVVASDFGEIDPRLHGSFRLGLVESSVAAALNNFLEDETDEPESAILAPAIDGSQEAAADGLLQLKLLEEGRTPDASNLLGAQPMAEEADGVQPATGSVARRELLLEQYKQATGNPSNKRIYEARNSGIHKPEFYKWRRGELPADSRTTINFECFLRDKKPPIPRKPKS